MSKAELHAHQVSEWGRDYRESDDGYTDMEAEERRGWRVIPNWGRNGWDLGKWPWVMIYERDGHGKYELLQIVEGDRTMWAFESPDDFAAAVDFLFLWHAAFSGKNWSPVRAEDIPRLEAGELEVDIRYRGPYRMAPSAPEGVAE